jgi:DNA-binding IclR family transcriptional regulator
MWHIRKRLTMTAFAEVKAESLAAEMRLKDTTVGQMLTLLVQRGYLDESGKKKPRAFRLPWSRRVSTERAA